MKTGDIDKFFDWIDELFKNCSLKKEIIKNGEQGNKGAGCSSDICLRVGKTDEGVVSDKQAKR